MKDPMLRTAEYMVNGFCVLRLCLGLFVNIGLYTSSSVNACHSASFGFVDRDYFCECYVVAYAGTSCVMELLLLFSVPNSNSYAACSCCDRVMDGVGTI